MVQQTFSSLLSSPQYNYDTDDEDINSSDTDYTPEPEIIRPARPQTPRPPVNLINEQWHLIGRIHTLTKDILHIYQASITKRITTLVKKIPYDRPSR